MTDEQFDAECTLVDKAMDTIGLIDYFMVGTRLDGSTAQHFSSGSEEHEDEANANRMYTLLGLIESNRHDMMHARSTIMGIDDLIESGLDDELFGEQEGEKDAF